MSHRTMLLHGALGSSDQMKPLAELLDREVVVPDLLGHGLLAGNNDAYSIEGFAECLLENLSEPVNIFGYSMGGYVALYLAAKYPEKVLSVTTLATKFDWTPEGAQQEVRMLNPEKVMKKVPGFAKLLESRHGEYWPSVMKRTADLMLNLGDTPVLSKEILRSVKCPVQLLRGSEDNMVSRNETLWAKEVIANACYTELIGQPHPFEKMDMTNLVKAILG